MPLDHEATATNLEYIAKTGINIAIKSGSVSAIKTAKDNSENLLGLADWHQDQAAEYQRKENLHQLHQAAEKTLTQTS
tara:strand:+ start:2711 stop:2944 length:234 start_codon:yes stop_codon:yes gene_type:complete